MTTLTNKQISILYRNTSINPDEKATVFGLTFGQVLWLARTIELAGQKIKDIPDLFEESDNKTI